MGEVIRKVNTISLGGSGFDIELNHSVKGGRFRDIHIQNDKFRLEMPENEFLPMAACILLAKKQFDIMKGNLHD